MSIPTLGGWLWVQYGVPYVFVAAAAIAFLNLVAASFIRAPRRHVAVEALTASEVTGPD